MRTHWTGEPPRSDDPVRLVDCAVPILLTLATFALLALGSCP